MIAATVPAQPINIITTFTGTNVIVSWTLVDDGGAPITAYTAAANTAGNGETNRKIVINNFLGFIGSLSTPVLDLTDTGDIYIEIRWAPTKVLWGTTNTTAPTYNVDTGCSIDDLRMTCSKINFESSEYYDLKAQKFALHTS